MLMKFFRSIVRFIKWIFIDADALKRSTDNPEEKSEKTLASIVKFSEPANMIDYTQTKIEFLPVKLEKYGLIHVTTPTKAAFDELMNYAPKLVALENLDPTAPIESIGESGIEAVQGLYNTVALLMSRNKENVVIVPNELSDILALDQAIDFLNQYAAFVNQIKAAREKN